jgi:mono/diheme cytochrome c family protein
MKRSAILLALFLLATCRTTNDHHAMSNAYLGHEDSVRAGAKLFRYHCAQCHGSQADGRGEAPSLKSERVRARNDGALFAFITNGDLKRGMPSWSHLPEERRWQLVAYLKSL